MASNLQQLKFESLLKEFKRTLKRKERENFRTTTFKELEKTIGDIQARQHSQRRLQNLNRLKPFLEAVRQYEKVIKVFYDNDDILAFIWGPIRFLLQIASADTEAFSELLDTYESIGENLPLLLQYKNNFSANPQMCRILFLIYEKILEFHHIALDYFQQPQWKQLFKDTWNTPKFHFSSIISEIGRHRSLVESEASPSQIEDFHESQRTEDRHFETEMKDEDLKRYQAVYNWLRATNMDTDHYRFSEIRKGNPGTGKWLLENQTFKKWFDPQFPAIPPLLWLNGIPGAGKTVLASLVIEEAQKLTPTPSVLFFYCKDNDSDRNNFPALARSLLAQFLKQDRGLLLYFYQKCYSSGQTVLTSPYLIEDLLNLAFKNCKSAYIVLDGLDECAKDERKKITQWFRKLVEDLPTSEPERLRCLFVSQNGGVARNDFFGIASIEITAKDNKHDIDEYSRMEADKLKKKFQLLEDRATTIASTVADSVGGIFLLAKLIWINLSGQTSMSGLENELEPNVFPEGINDAYGRIMARISQQASHTVMDDILTLFGWLVIAKRPLKWHEIQGLKSTNLDEQSISFERQRFVVSPKDLCESLVETRSDGSLELVHLTAKFFFVAKKYIDPATEELKLACLCIDYLNLPAFVEHPTEDGVRNGDYGFMDYAVLYWIRHLEAGIVQAENQEPLLDQLAESLGIFVSQHWNSPTVTVKASKRTSERLRFFRALPFYDKLERTVELTNKQLKFFGKMRKGEIALNLVDIVGNVRKVLEQMVPSSIEDSAYHEIEQKYGNISALFKCPRFSCRFFTKGFPSADERDKHIDKHDRPFRCTEKTCPGFAFGFTSAFDRERHMKKHSTTAIQDQEFPTEQDVEHSIQNQTIEEQAPANPIDSSEESEPETRPSYLPPQKRQRKTEYPCIHCPMIFKKLYNLNSHLQVHTTEKRYTCRTCGKGFVRLSDLTRHEKKHTGEKNHVCAGHLKNGDIWGCGKSFSRADILSNHHKSKQGQECLRPFLDEQKQEQGEQQPQNNPI